MYVSWSNGMTSWPSSLRARHLCQPDIQVPPIPPEKNIFNSVNRELEIAPERIVDGHSARHHGCQAAANVRILGNDPTCAIVFARTLPLAFDGKTPVEAAFVLDVLETRVLSVTETGATDIS